MECPVCHSSAEQLLRWDTYEINRCGVCRLVFSTPTPSDEELSAYYQGFMFRMPEDRAIERATKRKAAELKKTVGKELGDGHRFLDFGGGTGIAYHAAKQLGYDAYYQDLDQESVRFVQKKFGLKTDRLIEHLSDADIQFDVIFSDNVIEHVPEPASFVGMLYDKVDGDGFLIIKTPHAGNAESWFNPVILLKEYFFNAQKSNSFPIALKACFKGFWHCAPPRHLFSFSKESLLRLALEAGASESDCEITYYSAPLFCNTVSEYMYSNRCGGRSGIMLPLLWILVFPVALIESVLQLTGALLVRCRLVSAAGIILKMKKSNTITAKVEPV